jgi:hypothetical protein
MEWPHLAEVMTTDTVTGIGMTGMKTTGTTSGGGRFDLSEFFNYFSVRRFPEGGGVLSDNPVL